MFVSLQPHRAIWITAILLLLIALASPVEAQQRGQLVLDRGLVKVSNDSKVRIYNVPGTTVLLSVGDQVHAARNSAARVILSSGDEVVTIRDQTIFRIEEANKEESNTRLLIGNIAFNVNPNRPLINGRKRSFNIRTVTAVLGIRGTDGEAIKTETGVQFELNSGSADIEIPGSEIKIEIGAGESAEVQDSGPIKLPGETKFRSRKAALKQEEKKQEEKKKEEKKKE